MHSNGEFNSLSDTMILYNGVKGLITVGSKNRALGNKEAGYSIGRGQVKLLN